MIKKITLNVKPTELPALLLSVRKSIREAYPEAKTVGDDWDIKITTEIKNRWSTKTDKDKNFIHVYFKDPKQALILKLKFSERVVNKELKLIPKRFQHINKS
jgi:hypothetical protein